eukprot:scaffold127509_cov25-Tisochrysis_lutea.AAC.1
MDTICAGSTLDNEQPAAHAEGHDDGGGTLQSGYKQCAPCRVAHAWRLSAQWVQASRALPSERMRGVLCEGVKMAVTLLLSCAHAPEPHDAQFFTHKYGTIKPCEEPGPSCSEFAHACPLNHAPHQSGGSGAVLSHVHHVTMHVQRSKTEVLLRSMLGKRWTEDELFHASWDDVPPGVKGMLHDYQKALE